MYYCCLSEKYCRKTAIKLSLWKMFVLFFISQPKWLKFGLQPHLIKMFLHTKFQLSITCTFRFMKLLVEITKYLLFKFDKSESKSDRELKFCVSKHLQKMCLETKFQPFRLRNDGDIERSTWNAKIHLACQ